ncbi:MAG: haloacid dehalogenase type II, partial [Chloroflexota bacterium]|nr:haloacid dehalogenase type II [Chloroflexota bacterium]
MTPAMLTFDVFGTVVDWHTSVTREGEQLAAACGLDGIDWAAFATAWRGRYGPSMAPIRDGRRAWVRLDVLHRENLVATLAEFGVEGLTDAQLDPFNRAWPRPDPSPDSVAGPTRL